MVVVLCVSLSVTKLAADLFAENKMPLASYGIFMMRIVCISLKTLCSIALATSADYNGLL